MTTTMIESEIRWLDCLDRALQFVKMREQSFDDQEVIAIANRFYGALLGRHLVIGVPAT